MLAKQAAERCLCQGANLQVEALFGRAGSCGRARIRPEGAKFMYFFIVKKVFLAAVIANHFFLFLYFTDLQIAC